MRPQPLRPKTLEGPLSQDRMRHIRARFTAAARPDRSPRRPRLAALGRRLLVIYWLACIAIILAGVDRLRPDLRQNLVSRADVAGNLGPFATCAAAHAAGIYDIPTWSRAYKPEQDGDGDGLACEPYRP